MDMIEISELDIKQFDNDQQPGLEENSPARLVWKLFGSLDELEILFFLRHDGMMQGMWVEYVMCLRDRGKLEKSAIISKWDGIINDDFFVCLIAKISELPWEDAMKLVLKSRAIILCAVDVYSKLNINAGTVCDII